MLMGTIKSSSVISKFNHAVKPHPIEALTNALIEMLRNV